MTIYKKYIHEVFGTYDLVMLHHSFEHMENPEDVLWEIKKHLNPDGIVLIRIPVADSYAWRKYGKYWAQHDAPRHYFLHTVKSINKLAEKTGMYVVDLLYDSTSFQFTGSEKYIRNISLSS